MLIRHQMYISLVETLFENSEEGMKFGSKYLFLSKKTDWIK
jgi:hypothetical protein